MTLHPSEYFPSSAFSCFFVNFPHQVTLKFLLFLINEWPVLCFRHHFFRLSVANFHGYGMRQCFRVNYGDHYRIWWCAEWVSSRWSPMRLLCQRPKENHYPNVCLAKRREQKMWRIANLQMATTNMYLSKKLPISKLISSPSVTLWLIFYSGSLAKILDPMQRALKWFIQYVSRSYLF